MQSSKFAAFKRMSQRMSQRSRLIALMLSLTAVSCTTNPAPRSESANSPVAENTETAAWVAAIAPDQQLAAMVPETIRADGVLQVATDPAAHPNHFLSDDDATISGWEIELTQAIAAKLGLRSDFYLSEFDAIPPNLQSGRYEVGVAAFTDNNTERGELDYVTLYQGGAAIAVAANNATEINGSEVSTLCGQRLGVAETLVSAEPDLTLINQQCQQAGQSAINVQPGSVNEITAAVIAGELDALLAESPVIGYVVQQSEGNLENLGVVTPLAPYGMAIPESAGQMNEAVMGALQSLIAEGVYQQILDRWGISDTALTAAEIDEVGSLDVEN